MSFPALPKLYRVDAAIEMVRRTSPEVILQGLSQVWARNHTLEPLEWNSATAMLGACKLRTLLLGVRQRTQAEVPSADVVASGPVHLSR